MNTGVPMDERARQAFCDIAEREGTEVFGNLSCVEAMLGDLCPGADGEVHTLLAAGKAGAAQSLERATDEQLCSVLSELSKKLATSYGMTRPVADWAALTWLIAIRPRAAAMMLATGMPLVREPAAGATAAARPPAPSPAQSARVASVVAPQSPPGPPTMRAQPPAPQPPSGLPAVPPATAPVHAQFHGSWRASGSGWSKYALLVVEPWDRRASGEAEGLMVSLYSPSDDAKPAKTVSFAAVSGTGAFESTTFLSK